MILRSAREHLPWLAPGGLKDSREAGSGPCREQAAPGARTRTGAAERSQAGAPTRGGDAEGQCGHPDRAVLCSDLVGMATASASGAEAGPVGGHRALMAVLLRPLSAVAIRRSGTFTRGPGRAGSARVTLGHRAGIRALSSPPRGAGTLHPRPGERRRGSAWCPSPSSRTVPCVPCVPRVRCPVLSATAAL